MKRIGRRLVVRPPARSTANRGQASSTAAGSPGGAPHRLYDRFVVNSVLAAIGAALLAGSCAAGGQELPAARPTPALTGWFSTDAYALAVPGQDPVTTLGYQITTTFRPKGQSGWSFDLNLRNRHYVAGNHPSTLFIYDAKATYRATSYEVSAGRMSIYDVGSIGTIDGVRAGYRHGSLSLGGYGGVVPDFYTAAFSSDTVTAGGYVTLQSAGGSRSDVALTEVLLRGKTERRFLSVQNFIYARPGTSLYQSLEYELGPGIPGANRLSRFLASGGVAVNKDLSFSGSFSFGRSIDYRRLLIAASDGGLITDPYVIGNYYYQNFMFDVRYRLYRSMRVYGGMSVFKRSQSDQLTRQVRIGISGVELAGFDINGSYARSLEASAGRGVVYLSCARSIGDFTAEVDYSNYGDAIVITEIGTSLQLTPVPGYQIIGASLSYRLAGALTLIAELQQARGEGNDYRTFYVRTIYRFR
ncbi:MAG: hypothetical protein AB1714_26660 [Acidobacteriota bacterium]